MRAVRLCSDGCGKECLEGDDATRQIDVFVRNGTADGRLMHPEGRCDVLHGEWVQCPRTMQNEIRLPPYKFLCHAAQRLTALLNAADERPCCIDTLCNVLTRLCIHLTCALIKARDTQTRQMFLADSHLHAPVDTHNLHIGTDVGRRLAPIGTAGFRRE